jgi:hypothetical protein
MDALKNQRKIKNQVFALSLTNKNSFYSHGAFPQNLVY